MAMELETKVLMKETGEVLFRCPFDETAKAYSYAAEMEEFGLEVEVKIPTITDSLAHGLGVKDENLDEYNETVASEIDDHDGSCCAKESDGPASETSLPADQ